MKKIISTIIFSLIVNIFVFTIPSTISAAGELEVTYNGNPLPSPLFNSTNMAPGDSDQKDIKVENNGSVTRILSVKAVRTGPDVNTQPDPKIETVLEVVISNGGSDLYGGTNGVKTLKNFFDDSGDNDGVVLNSLVAGSDETYNVEVTFPSSAGNPFQNKSVIFDLHFGAVTGENLVINEVFYDVDEDHGFDSPKDRGILGINGNNVTIDISGNGAGSTNTANVSVKTLCNIVQQNNADVRNAVNVYSNTGNNAANGNTGGNTNINTGNSSIFTYIFNMFNFNFGSCSGSKLGQNHEWIEIYNPTNSDITLKNWTLSDDSGSAKITANKKVKAGGFALLSKDSSAWKYWSEPSSATKIELGNWIGDGLGDDGDHLVIKNPQNTEVDFVAWEEDENRTPVWNSDDNPVADEGESIEREAPGFDLNSPFDFISHLIPPTPGN